MPDSKSLRSAGIYINNIIVIINTTVTMVTMLTIITMVTMVTLITNTSQTAHQTASPSLPLDERSLAHPLPTKHQYPEVGGSTYEAVSGGGPGIVVADTLLIMAVPDILVSIYCCCPHHSSHVSHSYAGHVTF